MNVIWKYKLLLTLTPAVFSNLRMPHGAKILTVHEQEADICLWALVDPTAPVETRLFLIVPTGKVFDDLSTSTYLGTVHTQDGLVLHIYETA